MMIIGFAGCRMTDKDHRICTRLLEQLASSNSPLAPRLREKLGTAIIVDADDAICNQVRLGSRVEFSMGGVGPVIRVLVDCDRTSGTTGLTLPVGTHPGIALLGMREGQSCAIEQDGRTQILTVHRILNKTGIPRRADGLPAQVIDFAEARATRSNSGDVSRKCRPDTIQTKERR